MTFSIIVPSMTPALAAGLRASLSLPPEGNLIIVDNTSDGDIFTIMPDCTITLFRNAGYPEGCNIGAEWALRDGVEALVFCNDDVVFHEADWNTALADVAPDCILGHRIIDDNVIVNVDGCIMPYTEGYLMAVHSETWKKYGPFDTRFGVGYFEEALLCTLARAGGVRLAPLRVRATHLGGQTTRRLFASRTDFLHHLLNNQRIFAAAVLEKLSYEQIKEIAA